MRQHFHTVVVGGGCLGCASAISIQRRLRQTVGTSAARVCLVEKVIVGSGVTARHSGIVRAANAVPSAAHLAKRAIEYWKDLQSVWGVSIEYDACGAVWIARDAGSGGNETWAALADSMSTLGIAFHAVGRREAERVCAPRVTLHDDEVYFFEPDAMVFDTR